MSIKNIHISADVLLWWIEGCGVVALNRISPLAIGKSDMAYSFEEFRMRTEKEMKDLLREGPSHRAERFYRNDLKGENTVLVKTHKLMELNRETINELAQVCAEAFAYTMAMTMYINGNKQTAWDDFVAQTRAIVGALPEMLHTRKILRNNQKNAGGRKKRDEGLDIEMRR